MLERSKLHNEQQRELWRRETIRQRQERISREVYDLCDGKVKYGPFTGLILDRERWWGKLDLGSQCLGLYELEFLEVIQNIKPNSYSAFIDIGAADGYYANGILLSRRIPHCVCFEISEKGQYAIYKNWIKNGKVGLLDIYGAATQNTIFSLPPALFRNSLVMIDIEGGEFDLLTDEVLKLLSASTILIEVHNWVDGFVQKYSKLLRNLSKFFNIEILPNAVRNTSSFLELRDFTDDNRALLTSEQRPCMMRFLKVTPK